MKSNGRTIRTLAGAAVAGVWLSAASYAQTPVEPPFVLRQVGPSVFAAVHNPKAKEPSYANAGFIIGDDGVVVVDTFANAEAAKSLLSEIRRRTKLPVKFVVNTHYHADHVAGNRVFADAGATVIAHRNVSAWIHTENLRLLGNDPKPELKVFVESLMPPTVVYTGAMTLHLGSREILIRDYPGHTGGDSVVVIPDANVAFGGDLLWRDSVPNLVDASVGVWLETLDAMAKNGATFTFVPGHGEVGEATEVVVAFRDYLATLHKLVADARAQKRSGKALADTVLPALATKYGKWEHFSYLAPLNIEQMEAELNGKKRIPQ
jgi:glyoxylase-like metal-dependent hydrolase (beta-lactamase superfamily II)